MSQPSSPPIASPIPSPRAFRDLGDLDYELNLTSPLSPPLPLPPPPSRAYTDELTKKSMPVDATPVIRLLAPTPEATSPKILLRPRRAGFVDDDDDEPFPDFFYPPPYPDSTTTLPSVLPSSRYSDGDASTQTSYSTFQDSLPWTDELTRQRRRHRRPTYGQSVFEEDTSSSSSSDESPSASSSPRSASPSRYHAQDTGTAESGPQTSAVSPGSVPIASTAARTMEVETGAGDGDNEENRDTNNSGPTAALDLTTFRFPEAGAAKR
ncbi:hypothetical protein PG984_000113 [Apiospora sp. TS-2023a]